MLRKLRIIFPYTPLIPAETLLPGGSSINGMNLSGNPGIVQPMQIPPTFGHIALDHRSPATDLYEAFRRAIFRGEVALLVISGPVTTFVHGLTEEPSGAQMIIQRDHRRLAGGLIKEIKNRLRQVVRMNRTAGNANDRNAGLRLPAPAQIVRNAHRSCGVTGHGVNTAVGGARSHR